MTLEERRKATEKPTRVFIESVRRRFRDFVLTLEAGIRPLNILNDEENKG